MQLRFWTRYLNFVLFVLLVACTSNTDTIDSLGDKTAQPPAAKVTELRLDQSHPFRYARSFQSLDGAVYLLGLFKVVDQGKRIVPTSESDPPWSPAALTIKKMNTFFVREGLFIAVGSEGESKIVEGDKGRHVGKLWRSYDNLKTIQQEKTVIEIPEAGKVYFGDLTKPGDWAGLFFHRRILEMPDGSLLAAMYGNFEQDTASPTNPQSKRETRFKLRTFVVRSVDQGKTWRYLSTVAAPDPAVSDDTEGYNEWSMLRLADGRLLGVMRTGHFSPMAASWSEDEGKTWSKPVTLPELGLAGVDPYLLRLSDGRLALAYGEKVQPPGSREEYFREYETRADPRRRCRLAIDRDGTGKDWTTIDVSDYGNRSAYPSIFEVEPSIIVYQSDLEIWRVEVSARK